MHKQGVHQMCWRRPPPPSSAPKAQIRKSTSILPKNTLYIPWFSLSGEKIKEMSLPRDWYTDAYTAFCIGSTKIQICKLLFPIF